MAPVDLLAADAEHHANVEYDCGPQLEPHEGAIPL